MNYLEELDIQPNVRSFFEPYLRDRHHWIAGDPALAKDWFICASKIDALAWLELNHQRYRDLTNLCFLTIGAVPHQFHAAFIQNHAPKRKLHFVFSNDDLGALCDLKLASYVRNKPLKVTWSENSYLVNFENKHFEFKLLSLNALEKASGYNFRIRTHKPKNTITYYEQLSNRHRT